MIQSKNVSVPTVFTTSVRFGKLNYYVSNFKCALSKDFGTLCTYNAPTITSFNEEYALKYSWIVNPSRTNHFHIDVFCVFTT